MISLQTESRPRPTDRYRGRKHPTRKGKPERLTEEARSEAEEGTDILPPEIKAKRAGAKLCTEAPP